MAHTLTAYFDTRTDAQIAADRLAAIGIATSAIGIHDSGSGTTSTTTAVRHEEKGFWASLGDLFVPDEDRYTYEEGIRRGGSVLTVRAERDEVDRVSDVLESAGAVDLDTRESEWKTEGWTGYDTARTAGTDGDTSMPAATTGALAGTSSASYAGETGLGRASAVSATGADRDGTIEVVEENLRVGKRDVSLGRVRVRSYVVEDAVSEDVALRSERVEIERRAVDRPVSSLDGAFRDQTIELEETSEEAVVSKEARVKEEIDISKVAENRTQTISDTVRRTEVEIEDERLGRSGETSGLTDEELARRRGSL